MGLTNPGTPMDEDGWADVLSDIRKLFLLAAGGGNDTNNSTTNADQVADEFKPITITICEDGITKTMKVMGTDPQP